MGALLAAAPITAMVVALKLADIIDWSWWWVLGPPAVAAVIAVKFLRK